MYGNENIDYYHGSLCVRNMFDVFFFIVSYGTQRLQTEANNVDRTAGQFLHFIHEYTLCDMLL